MPLVSRGVVVTSDTHEALFGCNHLGCIAMISVASCIPFPFSASCNDMLTMLVCAPVGFVCIFTRLLICSCMNLACWCVIHASTQWSRGHSIQTYICPSWTPFVLLFVRPFCLFVCYLACLLARVFPCILVVMLAISILLVHFASFCYYLHIFLPSLICWFSCLCLFVYTHGARAWSPRRKQKGQGREQVVGPSDCSQ